MGVADDTLAAFGDSIGIPGLAFNAQGVATLAMEATGTFCFERVEGAEDILVYLVRPFSVHNEGACMRALQACHYSHGHAFPVTAGLKGEEMLVFLMRVPEPEFTLQTVEQCIQQLAHLHENVASV